MSNKARQFKSKRKPQSLPNWSYAQPIKISHLEDNLTHVLNLDESFTSMILDMFKKKFHKDHSIAVVTDDGKEINRVARDEAGLALAHTALNSAYAENLTNNSQRSFSRSWFFHSVKEAWRSNVRDLKSEGKSFFAKMRDSFAQKTPVRASSILVHHNSSVISLQNTVKKVSSWAKTAKSKILCNKFATNRLKVAGTAAFATVIMACSNGGKQAPVQVMDAQSNNIEMVTDTIVTPAYVVPTDSTRVQSGDLNSTIRFLNNSIKDKEVSGYEFATQRLTDDVMENHFPGKTRDEVLNAYRYIRSFYPNPDKAEKMGVSSDLVKAARTAQALDQFLSGCDDKLPENCGAMFVEQVKGEYNIRATGVQNPCDDAKVLYTGRRHAAKKAAKVKHNASTTVQQTEVEEAVAPVVEQVAAVEDSVVVENPQTDFEATASSLQNDTVYTQNVTTNPSTLYQFRSNEDLDAKDTKDATQEDVLGLNTGSTKVDIENQQTDFVDVDAMSSSSGISEFKGNSAADTHIVRDNVPADEVENLAPSSISVDIENPAGIAAQTDFVDVAASYVYTSKAPEVAKDSTSAASAMQTDFVDVDAYSYTTTTDSLSSASAATSSFDATSIADNAVSNDSVIVKILADSDTISRGTPGAGYVAERGGFENRGLSKEDIDYARKKLGDDTYEQIVAEAPKEWFAKGGIAEGLTPDQFAYITAVLAVTEPHGVAVTAIMKSINCGDTITSESVVKAAVDGVHKNKTRDGWTYSKRIYVDRVNNNGCGKKLTLKQWRTRKQKPTTASGPKFPRYFEQRGVLPRQTAFEEAPSSLTIDYQYVQNVQVQTPDITEFRSNEDLNPRKTDVATAEQVLGLETGNTKVMVEDATPTVQQPKHKKAANRRKQAKKEAERAEREKMALLQHYAQR